MVCLLCTVKFLAFFDCFIFIFDPKTKGIPKKTRPHSFALFRRNGAQLPPDSTQYTAPLRGGLKIEMVCLLCKNAPEASRQYTVHSTIKGWSEIEMVCLLCTVKFLAFFDCFIFIFDPKTKGIPKKTRPHSFALFRRNGAQLPPDSTQYTAPLRGGLKLKWFVYCVL